MPGFLFLLHAGESEDEQEFDAFVKSRHFVDVGLEGVEGAEEDVEDRLQGAQQILRRLTRENALHVHEGWAERMRVMERVKEGQTAEQTGTDMK